MEKVVADNAAKQRQFEEQTATANTISLLESELSQYQAQSDSYKQEIATLDGEIKQLDPERDAGLIATLTAQKKVAVSKKELYDTKILETQTKINKLKEAGNE